MRITIAIPALNESRVIAATVSALRAFCDVRLAQHQVSIVVADNGSNDGTADIVERLAAGPGGATGVSVVRLKERGKGRAIKAAWASREADAYVFMDADLAVDLEALPALIATLEDGADLALGSRYHRDARVTRSAARKVFSLGYRAAVGIALETDVSDLPCGFKAVRADALRQLLPEVRDDRWFFDTELVVRAERAGLRIVEIPVTWKEARQDGRDSKVRAFALAREYAGKIAELRRSVGPRRYAAAETPTVRGLLRDTAPVERKAFWTVSAFIVVIGMVPPFIGMWWAQKHGTFWSGRPFLSSGDFSVYLSYIAQARDGHLFLHNWSTTEPLTPVFNLLWVPVGWLSRLLMLSPTAAFHAARSVLILPLAAVVYAFCAYVFRGVRARIAAFVLFMLGGGIGLYVAAFLPRPSVVNGVYPWPIDLWVSESNAFMSMLYSPHFTASWALLLLAPLFLLMAYRTERLRYGAWAGLAALALFQFHPFHVPTLWLLAGAAVAAETVARGFRPRQWGAFALFLLISFPTLLYHYWLTHWTANSTFMLDNNVNVTPPLFYVMVGLGVIVPLAAYGWWLERRASKTAAVPEEPAESALLHPQTRRFLAVWVAAQAVLVYSPFVFQRRLLEGLQFPLTLLAIPALAVLASRIRIPQRIRDAVVVLGCALLLLPTAFSMVHRSIEAYTEAPPDTHQFSAQKAAALHWLRDNSPKDAIVLTGFNSGNDVIGWAERYTYVGHWANTVDSYRKQVEVYDFINRMSGQQRQDFVDREGIDYVLIGPAERTEGYGFGNAPWLWKVFANEQYSIYQVMR